MYLVFLWRSLSIFDNQSFFLPPLGVESNVLSRATTFFLWLLYLEHFIGGLSFSSKFSATWNLGLLLGLIRSQYLVRFLSLFWITGGHTIHRPIEGLLPPTDTKLTYNWRSVFKVAGLHTILALLLVLILVLVLLLLLLLLLQLLQLPPVMATTCGVAPFHHFVTTIAQFDGRPWYLNALLRNNDFKKLFG